MNMNFDDYMVKRYSEDPSLAAAMLSDIMSDLDSEEAQGDFLIALGHLAKAFGGVGTIATKANLNAKTAHRTLSKAGNPTLATMAVLLRQMGLRLSVTPMATEQH